MKRKNKKRESITSLDYQIEFMKEMNKFVTNPLFISILNSLKELKGIKESELNNLKKKGLMDNPNDRCYGC